MVWKFCGWIIDMLIAVLCLYDCLPLSLPLPSSTSLSYFGHDRCCHSKSTRPYRICYHCVECVELWNVSGAIAFFFQLPHTDLILGKWDKQIYTTSYRQEFNPLVEYHHLHFISSFFLGYLKRYLWTTTLVEDETKPNRKNTKQINSSYWYLRWPVCILRWFTRMCAFGN